jgi:hypothetical protein
VTPKLPLTSSHDGYISIFDPLPSPPLLLRSFLANHLSSADATVAASDRFDARYYTVNRLILENDLVVASIGRKVFAWRAGTAKGRQAGKKDTRRPSGGRGEFKAGGSRGLDMKARRTITKRSASTTRRLGYQTVAKRRSSRRWNISVWTEATRRCSTP